jgi:peptidoglycan/LPS O-acetylase OafA/YrhL
MQSEIKKLDYIDAVRGIAVLMVLFVHTLTFSDTLNLNHFFRIIAEQGRMGVQLFYMASAFTLFYSLSQRVSNSGFFTRRIFRIAPMFYIASIFYFFLYTIYPNPSIEAASLDSFTFSNLFSHLAFTHGFSPYWINTIVPGGWSVGVEMLFYLLVPAAYFLYKNYGVNFLHIALASSTAFSWIFNYSIVSIFASDLPKYWPAFLYYNFFTQLPIFILGMILYDFIVSKKKSLIPLHIILLSSVVLFYVSTVLNKIVYTATFAGSMLLLSALLAYFIIFMSIYKPKILVNRVFAYLGKISYSMYLTHFASIALISYFTKGYFKDGGEITFLFSFLLLVLVTLGISSLTYKYIEKPMIIKGNKLIEKRNLKV